MRPHDVDNVNMNDDDAAFERPYHHGNLRSALIEAGLRALEQTDASELSLRAIAREVGVSANAAYRHFADKPALLRALAAEGFRRFDASQQAAHRQKATTGTMAGTQSAGRAYIGFAQAHPALFRLMFGNLFSQHKDPELMAASMAAFQGLLNSAAHDLNVSAGDERAMIAAITRWSVVHGLSHLLLDGQLAMFGDRVDDLIERIICGPKNLPLPEGLHPPAKAVKKPASPVKQKPSARR